MQYLRMSFFMQLFLNVPTKEKGVVYKEEKGDDLEPRKTSVNWT